MKTPIPTWVRWGTLATLAVPQLMTGVWAVLAPHNWFENFPGLGPAIVSADPPFNAHLATDAGAGFLATGIALSAAAIWVRRDLFVLALTTFLAFSVPHVLFHIGHKAPGLNSLENARSVAMLATSVVLALVFLWGLRPVRATLSAAATG